MPIFLISNICSLLSFHVTKLKLMKIRLQTYMPSCELRDILLTGHPSWVFDTTQAISAWNPGCRLNVPVLHDTDGSGTGWAWEGVSGFDDVDRLSPVWVKVLSCSGDKGCCSRDDSNVRFKSICCKGKWVYFRLLSFREFHIL